MTRQWTVKVDGNNVKTLHDGESVEIGRKPLRPLSDDGFARLDIMDPGKSMSKRHAVLSVDKQGNCSVRDLHSTNGSFVVTNNGQLMRLPAGEDIKLPIDSMTLQFGDVRLTLESAFEHDDEDDDATSGVSDDTSQPVSNLFEYAVSDEAPQEPDAADMSVDDIQPHQLAVCFPASRRRSSTRAMSPTVPMLCTRRNVRPSRRSMPTSRNSKMHSPRSPWFRKPSWPRTSPATCSPTPQRRPRLKLRSRPMRPIPLMRLRCRGGCRLNRDSRSALGSIP